MNEIPKTYNSQEVEDKIYKKWEESGKFNPDNLDLPKNAKNFSIAMPPPNATGILHVGHASMLAYQDLMIRYNRLKKKRTLWLPGTDHAAIATQAVVEKIIAKEGKTKYDLGREKFLFRVNEFIANSQNTIKKQVRKMGSSCDWSRERYTLDPALSQAVKEVFVKMYDNGDGLIYRGYRIVNWCPHCESTLADDEVEYKEERMPFYYFKYGPIIIGTARPETKFADKIIVVHPGDSRYTHLIGKKFTVPWIEGDVEARVIADPAVDKDFGTGAMTVTPAHSFEDFELARKYGLEIVEIIDKKGNLTKVAGQFAGMNANKAREAIVEKMKQKGLVDHIDENYIHNLSVCYRCGASIEPLPSLQWFIDVNKKITIKGNKYFKNKSLKEVMLKAVKGGEIKIIPERFEKIYFHWIENLRDWCISRQLWFGHRIPVWYRNKLKVNPPVGGEKLKVEDNISNLENQEIYAGVEPPEGEGWVQDPDTLDTWFSSGMWTFSTLLDRDFKKHKTFEEWMKNSPDLKKFHPTSVMETGYDILFFWVARMILMTTYAVGEIPFEMAYLHGMVRDKQGRKMSKSLGNGIDPLEMIGKYGTDALRMSMIIGSSPGGDIKLYEEKVEGYRNFANKLWNISRFILTSVSPEELVKSQKEDIKKSIRSASGRTAEKKLTLADKWILAKLSGLIKSVTKDLDNFNFSAAGEEITKFMWDDFADWYLEIAKIEIRNDPESKKEKTAILLHCLKTLLKLLHPFTPFVTEEIWSKFDDSMLMAEKWPEFIFKAGAKDISDFNLIKNNISAIRNLRSENKIEPAKKIKAIFFGKQMKLIKDQEGIIKSLARLEDLVIASRKPESEKTLSIFIDNMEIYLPLEGLLDIKKELARTEKEIKESETKAAELKKRLSNKDFLAKAKKEVVFAAKENLTECEKNLEKLEKKRQQLI